MGRKVKFRSLFKKIETKSSWPWGSCGQLKTLSFRNGYNDIFRTINAAYLETTVTDPEETPARSLFSNSSETANFDGVGGYRRRSERGRSRLTLRQTFFDLGETSSITAEVKEKLGFPFKESIALSMESEDPHVDFRKSMEEMVEAHGLKDWKELEELLFCFLMTNGKNNHELIIGAFVDLLVDLAFSDSDFGCCCDSSSSLSSFCNRASDSSSSTPGLSSSEIEEIDNGPFLSCLVEAFDE